MAGTQQKQLGRKSLFNISPFDDPEALSQIATVENPPAPAAPSPQAMSQVPFSGAVPKSFTEWYADPMNLEKVPPMVPRGTPMPSLVAQKAEAAASPGFLKPVTSIPPIDSSLEGEPDLLQPKSLFGAGPLSTQQAPSTVKAASPEDALFGGPPSAAPQPAPGPPSRQDFLSSLPGGHAPIAGPPPSYQGKKLAAMGLFTALDSIGAALTHGEATVGPGLIRNAQALAEYNRNLPATQSAADTAAYEERLKEGGLINAQTKIPVTVTGPDGKPVTMMVDPATAKSLLPAEVKAGATRYSADKGAQSRMDVKQLELAIQQGQISKMVPGMNPDNGRVQYEFFNKNGQSIGFAENSVVLEAMPKVTSTVEFKEDGDGNLHALPKTTTSAPLLPGGSSQTPKIAGPPKPLAAPQGTPPTPQSQGPLATAPRTAPPAASGGGRIVPGFLGKSAKETGVAFDPKSNQYYVTTRNEAATNGYQNFTKSTAAQVDADRQLNNRLTDVQTKVQRYESAIANVSEEDQNKMAYLLNSDKFKLGAFGAEIPVDEVNTMLKAHQMGALSENGVKAFQAYVNGREAMLGYQRILTGGSRGNEKSLELLLDAFPNPAMPKNVINEGLAQFKENLRIAAQGLPRMPGITNQADVESGKTGVSAGNIQPPPGASSEVYAADGKTLLGHIVNNKFVPLNK